MKDKNYIKKIVSKTHHYVSMICDQCKKEIIQSGGDGFGRVFFKCACNEWESINANLGTIGNYDGKGIRPI